MFELKDNQVIISPDKLSLPFFKVIYDSDKSKSKEDAFKQLSYVFYLADYKSPYASYPQDKRRELILKDIIKDSKFKESPQLLEAIERYKELNKTTSLDLLESVKGLLYKLKNFFDTIDFGDNMEEAITIADKAVSIASKLGKSIETLNILEEKVKKELTQKTARRGGAETAEFELPE